MAKLLVAPDEEPRRRDDSSGNSGFWASFFLLTLISVGTGAFVAFQSVEMTKESLSAEYERSRNQPAIELNYEDNARLRKLDPLVTNLAAPTDAWVRVKASIVLSDEFTDDVAVLTGHIEEDMLAYLRTLTISHLEGAVGLQHLREDLNERAKVRSNGQVHEVILESLVIQ